MSESVRAMFLCFSICYVFCHILVSTVPYCKTVFVHFFVRFSSSDFCLVFHLVSRDFRQRVFTSDGLYKLDLNLVLIFSHEYHIFHKFTYQFWTNSSFPLNRSSKIDNYLSVEFPFKEENTERLYVQELS